MNTEQKLNKAGIYQIRCLINDKRYIGSCDNFIKRFKSHIGKLNKEKGNKYIQEDWNKYGKDNFVFEILEVLPIDDMLFVEKENLWMEIYKTHIPTHNNKYGYNIMKAHRIGKNGRKNISKANSGENNFFSNFSKKGEENHNTKITLEECNKIKLAIIELRNKNIIWDKIESILSKRFKVSTMHIQRIRKGTHWASEQLGGKFSQWIIP